MEAPQLRIGGLPSRLERCLADGASGSPPAGCALPASLSAQSASASFSPFFRCSLPSPGAQDSVRASVPAGRGHPWSHLPLQDTTVPRFRLPQVGSGRPGPPLKVLFLCRDVSST